MHITDLYFAEEFARLAQTAKTAPKGDGHRLLKGRPTAVSLFLTESQISHYDNGELRRCSSLFWDTVLPILLSPGGGNHAGQELHHQNDGPHH